MFLLLNGYRILVLDDEKVLEIDVVMVAQHHEGTKCHHLL